MLGRKIKKLFHEYLNYVKLNGTVFINEHCIVIKHELLKLFIMNKLRKLVYFKNSFRCSNSSFYFVLLSHKKPFHPYFSTLS